MKRGDIIELIDDTTLRTLDVRVFSQGEVITDDILNNIYEHFCIGK